MCGVAYFIDVQVTYYLKQ